MHRFLPPREDGDKNRRHKVSGAAPSDPETAKCELHNPPSAFECSARLFPANVELQQDALTRVSFRGTAGEVVGRFRPVAHIWRLVARRCLAQDEWDLEIRFQIPSTAGAIRTAKFMSGSRSLSFSITTPSAQEAGLCGEFTTDVHRTSCALGFQFSRRRFHRRRNWLGACAENGMPAMALARSRWRLRFAALSSGC